MWLPALHKKASWIIRKGQKPGAEGYFMTESAGVVYSRPYNEMHSTMTNTQWNIYYTISMYGWNRQTPFFRFRFICELKAPSLVDYVHLTSVLSLRDRHCSTFITRRNTNIHTPSTTIFIRLSLYWGDTRTYLCSRHRLKHHPWHWFKSVWFGRLLPWMMFASVWISTLNLQMVGQL